MQIHLYSGTTFYSLTEGDEKKLEYAEGLGMPHARRFSRRYPGQDGYDDLGHVLEPRTITLWLQFAATTQAELDERRDTLTRTLGPGTNAPLVLQVTRDDGTIRNLDVTATGLSVLPLDPEHRPGRMHRAVIKLRAADPIWYNPTAGTVTFGSADPAVWYLASNRIGTANVLDAFTNPGTAQAFTQLSNDKAEPYYIVAFRGTVPTSSTVTYTAWGGTVLGVAIINEIYIKRMPSTGVYANQLVFTRRVNLDGYYHEVVAPLGNYAGSVVNVIFANRNAGWTKIFVNENEVWRGPNGAGELPYLTTNGIRDWFSGGVQWRPVRDGTVWPAMQYATSNRQTMDESLIMALSRSMAGLNEDYSMAGSATYLGDYEEHPVITLTGPLSGPVVYNNTTGRKLDFTGSTVPAGDTYTIDLQRAALSVVDSGGTVRTNALTDDSDISGWNFDSSGPQSITVTASAGGTASSTQIVYRDRYVSY